MRRPFEFDRSLRELTFHYLILAEATTRTAISYCFSDSHRDHDAYLLQSSYCAKEEFVAYGMDGDGYLEESADRMSIERRRLLCFCRL